MTEYLTLAFAVITAGLAGFNLYDSRQGRMDFLRKCEQALAKATSDIRIVGADITQAAKKAAKTVNRQICSKCGKKVWDFNEYADEKVICISCENKMIAEQTMGAENYDTENSRS